MGKRTRNRARAENRHKMPNESKAEFAKRTTPAGKKRRKVES